jgi:hypothetical protein
MWHIVEGKKCVQVLVANPKAKETLARTAAISNMMGWPGMDTFG